MTLADVNWPEVIEAAVPGLIGVLGAAVGVLGTIVATVITQRNANLRHKRDLEAQLEKEREISQREINRVKSQLEAEQRKGKRQRLQSNLSVLKSLIREAEPYLDHHEKQYYRERLTNLRGPTIALGKPHVEESLQIFLSTPTPQTFENLIDECKKAIAAIRKELED